LSRQDHEFLVQPGQETRLDKFLVDALPQQSRSRLQSLVKDGEVHVNGAIVTKTSHMVCPGDQIQVTIPEPLPSHLKAEDIPLDIVYEDDNIVVINKPAGMVVHPAPGHDTGTLVHAVLGGLDDLEGIGGELRPGIVHRLDKDTSGLIVVAKNETAHRWLQEQFKLRQVEKVYLALVDGKPPTPVGRIEAAIARDPSHRKKMAIVSEGRGRPAVTEYRVVKDFAAHSLIEAHPLTGRTHQIRLHLAFLNCPIVGDRIYGKKNPTVEIDRHFLHARQLTLVLPGEHEKRTFNAPLPEELEEVLSRIK